MGEKMDNNQTAEEDMDNPGITFDNLIILKEFSNIADLVRIEDFLDTVPKAKLRRVKWVPMFNCLKQGILDEMVQEFSSMWEYENMPTKLAILEKQKEKYTEINSEKQLWRPQLGDVKAQLKARDVANLQKQKVLLESLAKEYETRVHKLKDIVAAKRGYLKALQMDIQKYQRKNEEFITKINDKVENHQNLVKMIIPTRVNVRNFKWNDDDLEIN
ncbi:uncharacterized protein LOC128674039 [Plodia interpunctella]|uniref:uncharacterized protein LOC128674039 n=1 Tax=Plodia interpunctella TaxID=58824 RepID=UPI0023678FC7|nr:uncharacterized protein LOC128674039 [Plodia interpunctella]